MAKPPAKGSKRKARPPRKLSQNKVKPIQAPPLPAAKQLGDTLAQRAARLI
ncbi:MAG: hypothetical protein KIS88_05845 [Anaerolineales bacterium]|nr:hypothetical protein [Anaerolineales bacterium]